MSEITDKSLLDMQDEAEAVLGKINALLLNAEEISKENKEKIKTHLEEMVQLKDEAGSAIEEQSSVAFSAQGDIQTAKEEILSAQEQIQIAQKKVETILTGLQFRAESEEELDLKIRDRIASMDASESRRDELEAQIEGLLPGATSAGLAKAFSDRKAEFSGPAKLWSAVLMAVLAVLLLVGLFDLTNTVKFESLWSYLSARLPIAIPAFWLAIYAGRKHGQNVRLEEEYAYKEALAKSFEGFKKEILSVEAELDDDSHTLTVGFIEQTMGALAIHPGRIYNGRQDNATPFDHLSEFTFFKRNTEKKEDGT